MLQDIRDKSQGWLSWVIVGAIAFAFIFFGTSTYLATKEQVVLAKINGTEITQREVDQFYDRYILQLSPEQVSKLDTSAVKKYALDALIQETSIRTTTHKQGFRVSQQEVLLHINQNPSFYEEGRFSPERYHALLSQNYFTDQQFRNMIEMQLLFQQLQMGLIQSNFALQNDLETLFKYIDQKRNFDYYLVAKSDFADQVKVTAEEAKEFYQQHSDNFKTKEKVKVEYLELSRDSVKPEIKFTEENLKEFYQDNIYLYSDPEKIKVAHILISFDSKDEKAKQAALDKVHSIEQKIDLGSDFGKLAEEYSDDPVSAKKEGELYWLTKGDNTLVKEFEDAAFALSKPNQVSKPILTPFGYHLIKLLERKPAKVAPFEEVQKKVEENYLSKKADDLVAEKADKLASMSYEYSDNLEKTAEALGLKPKISDYLEREPNSHDSGIENNPAFINAAFSDEVLSEGHNSDLVELSENHYVVLRLQEHKKSEPIPFEMEVLSIMKNLSDQKASQLASDRANELSKSVTDLNQLKALEQKDSKWKTLEAISRNDLNLPQQLVQKAFELPSVQQPNIQVGVTEMNQGDYAVIVLRKVEDGSIKNVEESRVKQMKESLAINMGQIDFQLFTTEAKAQAKVVME